MILPDENNFFTEFEKILEKNKQKKAYDINLIDELHANENAHTRILMKLLEFSREGNYFILSKVIDLLNTKLEDNYQIKSFSNPEFWQQWEQIDGYICSRTDNKAIIIENKIQWAEDQEQQIEKYVKSANNPKFGNIERKGIYVIYLTDNGLKKVTNTSLTTVAKEALDMNGESSGRFVEINYQDDLLPLFKEVLSYMDFSKEIFLKSALIQYIDYLDGRYGLREREKKFCCSVIQEMLQLFEIDLGKITNIKEKAELFFELRTYGNNLRIKNPVEFNRYSSFYYSFLEQIYPKQEQPGTVKNNFYHYFARNKENPLDLKPYDNLYINWNSYPNVIKFSKDEEPDNWFQLVFPKDDFSDSSDIKILVPENKFLPTADGWEKYRPNQYIKSIPYEHVYEKAMEPKEFLDYIFRILGE